VKFKGSLALNFTRVFYFIYAYQIMLYTLSGTLRALVFLLAIFVISISPLWCAKLLHSSIVTVVSGKINTRRLFFKKYFLSPGSG